MRRGSLWSAGKRNGASIAADPTLTDVWISQRRYFASGVSPQASCGYVARRSRRCRIVFWLGLVSRTYPLPLSDPRPVLLRLLPQAVTRYARGSAYPSATGFARPVFPGGDCCLGSTYPIFGLPLRVFRSSSLLHAGLSQPRRSLLVPKFRIGRRSFAKFSSVVDV